MTPNGGLYDRMIEVRRLFDEFVEKARSIIPNHKGSVNTGVFDRRLTMMVEFRDVDEPPVIVEANDRK